MPLTFDPELHRYELDGVEIPSVSRILRFMSREIYGDGRINPHVLARAADRGTRAHAATEAIDAHGEAACDPDIIPYVRAYMRFLRDQSPTWIASETAMYHPTLMYAGTIDRLGILKGVRTLVDLKCQEQIKRPLVTAQLNGYALMTEVDALACLQLRRDGEYRLHKIEIGADTFMACLSLHNALQKKKRRVTK